MKKYLLDYKSWKTAVVESARLETSGDAMQPLMEATVKDIQALLPLAELGKSGADGTIGPNTLAAIYKALTAAKAAVPAPAGTGGTSGVPAPVGTGGTSGVPAPVGTGGTSGTSGAVAPAGTSGAVAPAGTSGTAGTSGAVAPAGTSGAAAPVGTSGKVTLTSQQKIDAAKAALQKAEAEAKGERRGDKLERRIERKEGVVSALKSKLKVADS
jgi:hypothetical protein